MSVIGLSWRRTNDAYAIARAASDTWNDIHRGLGRISADARDGRPEALLHAAGDDVRAGRLDSDTALHALTTTMRAAFAPYDAQGA